MSFSSGQVASTRLSPSSPSLPSLPSSPPSLADALAYWVARQPDAPFLVEVESGRTITYAAFSNAVDTLRRQWETIPERGSTVALALPGGIAAAIVWIAALTGGHHLLPCAPESSDEERRRLAAGQRPDVIVVAAASEASGFGCPDARVFTTDEVLRLTSHATSTTGGPLPAGAGTLRLTTSGTTGTPKGVVLTAEQIAWTAEQVRVSHRLTPADRGLCVLPFFHINAPVVSLCASLLAGACVVIAPRFSVQRFWTWIERERITWASIVPTIVALLLTTERPAFLPGTLRFARSASAPLPVARHQAFEARFGIPLIETYGLSEAASQITANPPPPTPRKYGSVGLPTGVAIRICAPAGMDDADLVDLPPGADGEICVRGPNVIASYEGDADTSSFVNGWFRTGDLGYQDADGYLFITGRLREVINRGGEKIAPREIEEVLLAHSSVADAAVLGEPHTLYGQRVVAYITPYGDWDVRAEQRLRDYCAQRLSAYKVPEAFYSVPALPRNANGKLNRKALQGARSTARDSGADETPPQRIVAHG